MTKTRKPTRSDKPKRGDILPPARSDFDEILRLIETARGRAVAAVNTVLIDLYWRIGEHISRHIAGDGWGQSTVQALAEYIRERHPNARGFSAQNLWRMRQLFETYRGQPKLSTLLRELSWSHNLAILSRSKRDEEREFYLRTAVRERWSFRELQRQLNGALIELGRDFCFIGTQYVVQVGGRDFAIDLLFFHRGLNCLVAIELKIEEFQPEHLGKLEFYLEALDRDVKKLHERPSIGVLLCATKDHEVVEYALSRAVSPTLVAEYQTRLPDKELLRAKLHEFYEIAEAETARPALAAPAPKRERAKPRKGRS